MKSHMAMKRPTMERLCASWRRGTTKRPSWSSTMSIRRTHHDQACIIIWRSSCSIEHTGTLCRRDWCDTPKNTVDINNECPLASEHSHRDMSVCALLWSRYMCQRRRADKDALMESNRLSAGAPELSTCAL